MRFRNTIAVVLSITLFMAAICVLMLAFNQKTIRGQRASITFLATAGLRKETKQEIGRLLANKSMQVSRTECNEYGLAECDEYYFSNDIVARVYDNEATGNYFVILNMNDKQSTAEWREALRIEFNTILRKYDLAHIPTLDATEPRVKKP